MPQTQVVPPFVNSAMKFVLGSPMHGIVSNSLLLITFTGRKSGKIYTTPTSYSQNGDLVIIFTHAKWWKNLHGGSPVTLRIRGRNFQGLAEPVAEDKTEIAARLYEHLRRVPSDAKYYAVTFDDQGNPREEEVRKAVQTVVMIRVRMC